MYPLGMAGREFVDGGRGGERGWCCILLQELSHCARVSWAMRKQAKIWANCLQHEIRPNCGPFLRKKVRHVMMQVRGEDDRSREGKERENLQFNSIPRNAHIQTAYQTIVGINCIFNSLLFSSLIHSSLLAIRE